MKIIGKLKFVSVAVSALALCGCSITATIATIKQDAATLETQFVTWMQEQKANLSQYRADAQEAVQIACSLVNIGQAGLTAFNQNVSGVSSKVQTYAAQAGAYLNKGAAACSSYSATIANAPTPSGSVNQALAVWNAYIAAKAQMSAAQAEAAVKPAS
jgi:outer membrane murein-binding lipoprotein Lpp